MRLLVTRPEPDAQETAARLERLGHRVIVDPLLTVAFFPPPPEVPEPAAIVLTSRNAARALLAWPQAAAWRSIPVFAVGAETAAMATDAGFADVRIGSGDALALAALIEAELKPDRGPLLYPAVRQRGGRLDARLREAGFDLRTVEAYETKPARELRPATIAALRDQSLDGALFFSRRTAATFRDLVSAAGLAAGLAGVRLYAISEEAAAPLRDFAAAIVTVAARPDGHALLALIAAP